MLKCDVITFNSRQQITNILSSWQIEYSKNSSDWKMMSVLDRQRIVRENFWSHLAWQYKMTLQYDVTVATLPRTTAVTWVTITFALDYTGLAPCKECCTSRTNQSSSSHRCLYRHQQNSLTQTAKDSKKFMWLIQQYKLITELQSLMLLTH